MIEKLRIGYFADGLWSHLAFERIIKDPKIEIAFIIPRYDTVDNTLIKYSEDYSIDYFKFQNVNSVTAIEKIASYNCDLLVSMSFNQIFKDELIHLTPKGIINCHAGKLPFYRGRNILNWALINGEKEFGITVHFVDDGIDTGDIILQRTFEIKEEYDYSDLLNISYSACADILYDSLKLFLNNEVKRIPQDLIAPVGMYCGRRQEGDEFINWHNSSRDIFNFIRAIAVPGPKAHSRINNQTIKINKANFIDHAPKFIGKPGQILTKTENGFYVKTKDSFIEILEIDSKLKVGEVLN